ncbi:hypothetical protein [Arthrobacter sp. CAN_C5]|uniref:hypothetical protein n=1 Tax=Arthrobacter sp. CAN_C5 TaxID=2760706 RepID=UPI001AE73C6F|nr:hypothetical protein [Arthrobacter sp. CAN_C5]MBP2215088.1 antibiotic biosynthesis monooxygenase (ABM) superfamily enzyme [Arthrobacter sp. CAN_C5]
MTNPPPAQSPDSSTKYRLVLMFWLFVLPALTAIDLAFGFWLAMLHPVLRSVVLVAIAGSIVSYGIRPHLRRRGR